MIALLPSLALAGVDPGCVGKTPDPYFEQVQSDYLQNAIALAATFSPVHGPIPHPPGAGAVGVDVAVIPPLSCRRRFALNGTKTEDTNKSPALPRLHLGGAFPGPGKTVLYGAVGWLPPIPVAGQRSHVISGEMGLGLELDETWRVGGRLHATSMKTIADAATSLNGGAKADDLYLAHTFGIDALVGAELGLADPFLAVGVTDASTLFWIGDDGVMVNNMHPYFGPAVSAGADGVLWAWLRWGAEVYAAPGGHWRPDKRFPNQVGFGGYGHLYTVRLRVAVELGPD